MSKPFVSVVIPVCNDWERLKECLTALERQTYPKDSYEVIVVDNNSNNKIVDLAAQFSQVRFTHESYPTLHAARNKGISISKGEVLAFTDSDCIPDFNWLEKGVQRVLSTSNCGLVAGKIRVFPKDPVKPTACELFEMLTAFPQEKYVKKWNFGAPANLFTLRKVIEKVGVFNGLLKSGADLKWGKDVYKAGYRQIYADDACVNHPARSTLTQLYKKQVRVIGGIHDINKGKGYTFKKFLIDLKDDWPLVKDSFETVSNRKLSGIVQRIKILLIMLYVKFIRFAERIRLYFKK